MSPQPPMLHTGPALVATLMAEFPGTAFPGPAIMNDVYCAATRGWVEGPFAKYFSEYLFARDDLRWRKRGNQCEHFALRAMLEAVYLFGHDERPEVPAKAESLAVAAIKYRQDSGVWHEINLWLIDGEWLPWEPQTQKFLTLSAAERATVQQAILA